MAKAQKTAGRGSSLRYELIRDFSKLYNKNIPEYTDSDKERKLEIFNIPNSETSIVSGEPTTKGGGDHLYEVRGYYRHTSQYGIESEWNKLPVTAGENKSYKKMCGKDVGWQKLTEEELTTLSEDNQILYRCIQEWFSYCESRGVSLCFEMPETVEDIMEETVENALTALRRGFQQMESEYGKLDSN
jgi:hypothetical protein